MAQKLMEANLNFKCGFAILFEENFIFWSHEIDFCWTYWSFNNVLKMDIFETFILADLIV